MGTTPVYALPYPEPTDPADVPTDMHELALATETTIDALTDPIPISVVDANGDLIVGSGADAVTRLPVGTVDGHVLTVDATQPNKLKWSSAASGYPPTIPVASFPPASPVDGQECYLKLADGTLWHLKYDTSVGDAYKWRFVGGPGLAAFDDASVAVGTGPSVAAPRAGLYEVSGSATMTPSGASDAAATLYGGGLLLAYATIPGGTIQNMNLAGRQRLTLAAAGNIALSGTGSPAGTWSYRRLLVAPVRLS